MKQAYDRLPEPRDEDDGDAPQDSGGAGAGADSQPPSGGDESGDPSDPAGDGDDQGEDDGDDADGQGGNGDGQGQHDASDAPSHDPSGTGEVMDAGAGADDSSDSGEAPVDVNAEEQAWDEAMHQALNIARAEGKTPGLVAETIRNAHASKLDWRTLLRRYMTDAAKRDYSWSVPNRRFIATGLYLPSIRSEGIDTIAVIIDTSRSLSTQTLVEFWAELREVAAEIRPGRVIVLQVDTALQDAAEYAPDELPDEIAIKGRGGTDFRPGFEWLAEQGIQPGVCLYFTDMECSSYPESPPPFDVVWVSYGPPPSDWNREPWGERIDITT
ncbi:MAG: VWA-like domain-containing protein [Defluviicoccus sp.]|nr:VWA-like domain-containing protein [Defluviicoccus sp.]